jgi:hypothetical protein
VAQSWATPSQIVIDIHGVTGNIYQHSPSDGIVGYWTTTNCVTKSIGPGEVESLGECRQCRNVYFGIGVKRKKTRMRMKVGSASVTIHTWLV